MKKAVGKLPPKPKALLQINLYRMDFHNQVNILVILCTSFNFLPLFHPPSATLNDDMLVSLFQLQFYKVVSLTQVV